MRAATVMIIFFIRRYSSLLFSSEQARIETLYQIDLLKSAQLWDACAAAGVAGLWLTGKAPLSSSHALCFFVKQRLRNVSPPARSVRSFYNSSWLARVENQNLHLMLRPVRSCQ